MSEAGQVGYGAVAVSLCQTASACLPAEGTGHLFPSGGHQAGASGSGVASL